MGFKVPVGAPAAVIGPRTRTRIQATRTSRSFFPNPLSLSFIFGNLFSKTANYLSVLAPLSFLTLTFTLHTMSPLHKRANSSTSPRVNVEMAAIMHHTPNNDEEELEVHSPSSASMLSSATYENGEGRLGTRSVDGDHFGSERDSLDSEEDRAALLGQSQAAPSRRRISNDTWTQVKEISLEVRVWIACRSALRR